MLITYALLALLVAVTITGLVLAQRKAKQHDLLYTQMREAAKQRLTQIDGMRAQIATMQTALQAAQDQLRAANAKLELHLQIDNATHARRPRPDTEIAFADTEPMNEWAATQPYVPARPKSIEGIIGSYA